SSTSWIKWDKSTRTTRTARNESRRPTKHLGQVGLKYAAGAKCRFDRERIGRNKHKGAVRERSGTNGTRNARTGRIARNHRKEPKSNWDARDNRARTGRTGRKGSSQSEAKWDKRDKNARTGQIGRNESQRGQNQNGTSGTNGGEVRGRPGRPESQSKAATCPHKEKRSKSQRASFRSADPNQ
ncbi:hypothetical protein KI387_029603, partial [Taxus chinensis]